MGLIGSTVHGGLFALHALGMGLPFATRGRKLCR